MPVPEIVSQKIRQIEQENNPDVAERMRQIVVRGALCLALSVGTLAGTEAVTLSEPAVASAAEPEVTVGMPFSGKWAYDTLVNPDANGNYSDATSIVKV